jgi:hypothetical protein
MFENSKLQEVRDEAYRMSKIGGLNGLWRRAYEDLASAANHLEAMQRRTEDSIT